MPHDPKVTIWIPSYNHARFLPQTIESALAQTYTDFEVVIVDDGSPDDSLAVAESYATRYPDKVRVFTHPGRRNLGISETVNLCFEKSRGQYVSGLASDDLVSPDKLERQAAYLDAHPEVGWVYSYAEYVDEQGVPVKGAKPFGGDITKEREPLHSLIERNVVPGMTVLMRRSCVVAVGPHDASLVYSDWDYWVRMAAHAGTAFFPDALAKHRVHSYNTSVGVSVDPHVALGRSLEVALALMRKASSEGGALSLPRTRALLDLQSAFFLYCLGDAGAAALSMRAAFESDPSLSGSLDFFVGWLRRRLADIAGYASAGVEARGFSLWVAENLPKEAGAVFTRRAKAAAFALAAVASYVSDIDETRRLAAECLRRDPRWLGDAALRAVFIRSLLGGNLMGRLRRGKGRLKGSELS